MTGMEGTANRKKSPGSLLLIEGKLASASRKSQDSSSYRLKN